MTQLLGADDIQRALTRLAHEVVEAQGGADDLLLLGIQTRGVPLAKRLKTIIDRIEDAEVPVGALDVTLFRDDVRRGAPRPLGQTDVPVDVTGRTIRAALDAVLELGRPDAIRLVVLVDRGHRELPIRADHVGKNVPTALAQRISVTVAELDGEDAVVVDEEHGRGTGDPPQPPPDDQPGAIPQGGAR